jgi:hypothetical protein
LLGEVDRPLEPLAGVSQDENAARQLIAGKDRLQLASRDVVPPEQVRAEGGGAGDDVLRAGPGTDRIECGAGRDRVIASDKDKVADDCEKVVDG